MGLMEKASRTRRRRGEVRLALLRIVAFGGLAAAAVALPNLPKAVPKSLLQKAGLAKPESINTIVWRLKRQGLISFEGGGKRSFVRLTRQGKEHLELLSRTLARPSRQKVWDGKWRAVIFDIPERFRSTRDRLREEITEAGFYRLQDSVWIFPFPCEEYVALLKADQRIGKQLKYLIIDTIEQDRGLREHFGLPIET
jgi:DNA-binding transcriptional regulator PaaX